MPAVCDCFPELKVVTEAREARYRADPDKRAPEGPQSSLEIKVNYIKAMSVETGEVRCEANTIHVGGRTATAEGKILDAKGKLYAHGTTTCLIFRQ